MENALVEIPLENWPQLRDLFRRNWPQHVFAHGLLSNYLSWKRSPHGTDVNVRIYSLNDTWKDNGTFLLFDDFEIYFYSLDAESGYRSLADALCLVKWETYPEISIDFLEVHRPALDRMVRVRKLFVEKDTLTNFYYKPKEESKTSVRVSEGFRFNRVTVEHLNYIYNQWPLRNRISHSAGYNLLKRLLLLNESMGLFDKTGNLLSWCLRDQTGAFTDLQTSADYLRKGYARAVVEEFTRILATRGDDSYAYVLQSNWKSCALFESTGFRKVTNLHWVIMKPSMLENTNH